jgi:hypothetical protein
LLKENRRLADGWTYEPPTIYEKNAKALAEEKGALATLKPLVVPDPQPAME